MDGTKYTSFSVLLSVVYFDQRLVLNAGQNKSKTSQNPGISLKFNEFYGNFTEKRNNIQQQYSVVLFRIGPLGSDLVLGRRASWAVHGIGAWVVHGGVAVTGGTLQ